MKFWLYKKLNILFAQIFNIHGVPRSIVDDLFKHLC